MRLKPLKADKTRFYGFDVETTGKNNDFLCASLVNDTEQHFFTDRKECLKFLLNKNETRQAKIMATNLEFDFNALFQLDYPERIERFYRGHLIQCKVKLNEDNSLFFRDSMNYVHTSVEKLGKTIGLEKLPHPKAFGRVPVNDEEWEEMKKYNINDAFITFKFCNMLKESFNDLGCKMQMTIASTSMDLFKRKYLKGVFFQPSRKVLNDMYKSYYGGRCEVYKRGTFKKVNYYDFNSLYPSVMLENKFPDINTIKVSNRFELEKEGFSQVTLLCPSMNIPLLPVRKDKLIFPTGLIHGWYNHNELRKAFEIGYELVKWYRGYHFTHSVNLFSNFVTDLYSKRLKYKEESNDIMQMSCKLLLNSLYGKFAQKIDHDEKILHENRLTTDLIDDADKIETLKYGYHRLVKNQKRRYPAFIMPIWSSYITSYARLKLFNKLPKDVLYVDTDSIVTRESFENSKNLGDLKLEYKIDEFVSIKPKMYKMTGSYDMAKLKGVGKPSVEKFDRIVAEGCIKMERFGKWKESLRRDIKANEIFSFVKKIDLEDTKRLWKKPFCLTDQQFSEPINL